MFQRKGLLAVAFLSILGVFFLGAFPPGAASALVMSSPVQGKIIALDAGHGGSESGAVNQTYGVQEKDVNLATVYALKERLEADGAKVVLTRKCDETIISRRERVSIAKQGCQSQFGGDCHVLVSVHHNGSTDNTHDGTLVIYNEKQDVPLARAFHDALLGTLGLPDEGYLSGGYGMTIYGHLVSALTEALYITNDAEAELYLAGGLFAVPACGYPVRRGARVEQEATTLYQGLVSYFGAPKGKRGG